ncbi:hypothetical protein ACROYT_G004754 [Oculina patagonica]
MEWGKEVDAQGTCPVVKTSLLTDVSTKKVKIVFNLLDNLISKEVQRISNIKRTNGKMPLNKSAGIKDTKETPLHVICPSCGNIFPGLYTKTCYMQWRAFPSDMDVLKMWRSLLLS